jgi:adenylate cyclase
MERRLTAVVCADVVGYSKMMGADEAGTLASLKAHRAALDPIILNHGGRNVKTTGDGLLLEFPSIVWAVTAATEAQKLMALRNERCAD